MSTIVSKMQTVKGMGIGKSAVMGRLNWIWQQDVLERVEKSKSEEWTEFSRAVGIAISRIEESVEYLGESIPSEAAEEFSLMLGLIRSREFLCEIKDMIDGGIGVFEAVLHFEAEYKDDSSVAQSCALIMGIIQGFAEEVPDAEGDIVVIEGKIDISTLVFLARIGVSALVCSGEMSEAFVKLCEVLKISALIISEDDAYKCEAGEKGILYPDREALFVSPEIEVLSDFSLNMREDQASEIFASFCSEGIYSVFEYKTRKFGGFIIDAPNSEDEENMFIFYRRVVEAFGGKSVSVCLAVCDDEKLSEQLRAVCRAAVYGDISIAARVRGITEYEKIKRCFFRVCEELRGERREFEDAVSLGVMIDSIASFLVLGDLTDYAERIIVDMRAIMSGVLKEDKEAVGRALLIRLLRDISHDVNHISLLGEACVAERVLKDMREDRFGVLDVIYLSDAQ